MILSWSATAAQPGFTRCLTETDAVLSFVHAVAGACIKAGQRSLRRLSRSNCDATRPGQNSAAMAQTKVAVADHFTATMQSERAEEVVLQAHSMLSATSAANTSLSEHIRVCTAEQGCQDTTGLQNMVGPHM